MECLKSLSERFQLAREIYLTYLFGKSSDNTVLEELYKAAIEGSAIPMACIGLQYCQGKTFPDFPKNVELGVEFLKKAAYKNNATALGKIGYFYKKGINGFPRNSQKGERLLMLSSECGDKFAKNQLRD